MMDCEPDPLAPAEYGLEEWRIHGRSVVTLAILEGHGPDGVAIFRTLARLVLPPLARDELVLFGAWNSCTLRDSVDCEIVAICKNSATEEFEPVVRAWRANRRAGRFEAVDSAEVRCAQYVGDD